MSIAGKLMGGYSRQVTLFNHDLRAGQVTVVRGGMRQIPVSAGDLASLYSLPRKRKRRNRKITTILDRDTALFAVFCDNSYFCSAVISVGQGPMGFDDVRVRLESLTR